MTNTYTLINCEGDIFVIHFKNNKITAEVLLDDGSGKISFIINKLSILKYLHNEIKLNDLLEKSSVIRVKLYDYNTKSTSQIVKKQVGKLSCGDEFYDNLPEGMKLTFEKRVELAVRACHVTLDLEKIMIMIKDYYFLREKVQLLYLTFGKNNKVKKQYQKELDDLINFFVDKKIPFDFISYDEIGRLNIDKVCLKNDCNLDLFKIGHKDLNNVSNREMNYLVYHLSNLIADLNKTPRFWSKKAKNKYIEEYKDHYYPFKRNIVINNILK
ncbi:hypothetical protein G6N05_14105 [Flavobacterium sp. F372]|uniref:Uncharacterized protein n=1 Tax=Flavobacterium bernardetii TaxID=2813823 RepID=A0ABR7J1R7_9FLAO|nr:hypothetical protein [Flavobacterium bernardetii]MBC5836016.1 hypothetical protein [Flavobacterium bernardetii]NHF71244.1 hypothetical protein [Flavobacterium bernardetii]